MYIFLEGSRPEERKKIILDIWAVYFFEGV